MSVASKNFENVRDKSGQVETGKEVKETTALEPVETEKDINKQGETMVWCKYGADSDLEKLALNWPKIPIAVRKSILSIVEAFLQ